VARIGLDQDVVPGSGHPARGERDVVMKPVLRAREVAIDKDGAFGSDVHSQHHARACGRVGQHDLPLEPAVFPLAPPLCAGRHGRKVAPQRLLGRELVPGHETAQRDGPQRMVKVARKLLSPAIDPVSPFECQCHLSSLLAMG